MAAAAKNARTVSAMSDVLCCCGAVVIYNYEVTIARNRQSFISELGQQFGQILRTGSAFCGVGGQGIVSPNPSEAILGLMLDPLAHSWMWQQATTVAHVL